MPRRMRFDTEVLTFTTHSQGYIDPTTREWVNPESTPITATGDLQPFIPSGSQQIDLPEGFTLAQSKMFITDASLPVIDDVGAQAAATTTIGGRTFYALRKFDYSNGRMSTDSIFYILAMQPTADGSV